MRVLIVGGSSLLGKYLLKTQPDYVTELYQTWYSNPSVDGYQLDITNKSQVQYILDRTSPDLIINCAAIGNVDYAEKHYQQSFAVNVEGLENLIWAAPDAKIVHISSNAVYDGNNPPYSEKAMQRPVNAYGNIKKKAEQALMLHPNWTIVRPFMLYGWPYPDGRMNWATTIGVKLEKGESVDLVNDVVWQPTYALDCAKAIWKIALEGYKESFNVAAISKLTLYEFGLIVADIWGLNATLINPISSSDLHGIAKRPKDTSYDLSKIKAMNIKMLEVIDGLKAMKAEDD